MKRKSPGWRPGLPQIGNEQQHLTGSGTVGLVQDAVGRAASDTLSSATARRSRAAGTRHPTLMAVGARLYSLADAGLLDHGDVTRQLLAAADARLTNAERQQRAMRHGSRPSENEQACDRARAPARAAPDLPEGFRS